jgi:hypothetical protein
MIVAAKGVIFDKVVSDFPLIISGLIYLLKFTVVFIVHMGRAFV